MPNAYVIVAGNPGIAALVAAARGLGGPVVAVVAGAAEVAAVVAGSGADRVIWLGEPGGHALEAFAQQAAEVVMENPGVVFGGRRPAERVLTGAAAARLGAPMLTGITAINDQDGALVVVRELFGGLLEEELSFDGPVAVVIDGGARPDRQLPAVAIEERSPAPLPLVVAQIRPAEAGAADLAGAAVVVAVGRGLKRKEDLPLVESLAAALGAELGCTRPLAEGLEWLGRDRYIGISGQHIAPRLYLALGISGQLQHLAGVRAAHTIVSINSDPDAPMLADSDYALVGDLYDLVPALVAELR